MSFRHDQFGAFRIALIGDFSGRANRQVTEAAKQIAARRPVRVDRDSVDDAVARLAPKLALEFPDSGARADITFSSIEDFHPDSLYDRLPRIRELRDAGARAIASAAAVRAERSRSSSTTPANLLDAILGDAPMPPGGAALAKAPSRSSLDARNDGGLSEFVKQVLTRHLVPGADPTEADLEAGIDAAITAELRRVLHHPDFQRLEAAWRGVDFLVKRLDTDAELQLHLIDISREELAADLAAGAAHGSGLYQLIVEGSIGTPGAPVWALLVGMFSLGADEQDARLLESLGLLAHDAGAPFVAGASSEIAGTSSIAFNPDPDDWSNEPTPGWARLRESKAAASLSLVIPRLLMRVPYGKHSEPCDRVAFEELEPDQPPRHEHYLWGSGSLVAALLLGNAFTESGWTLRPGHEVGGLPFHAYRVSGETIATPCAETLLTDRACERLLERGLTPLLTVRDSDTVILPRLQSIAEPLRPLAGRWTIG